MKTPLPHLTIEDYMSKNWRSCEYCTVRFLARNEYDLYHQPACRMAAAKGKIHPAKLDYLLSDLRRLPAVSGDAREMTHLWAWRRMLELRRSISMAPKEDMIRALQAALDALLESSRFAIEGRSLIVEHRAKWQKMHDEAAAAIEAGTLKEWPEGLKEYPYPQDLTDAQ